ncbi:gamma-glutamylcyclotransferase [Diaphorobacter sp. NR2-3-3-1]|nr:gamma-glutamylcyclotransferase [Diaphorobacter caeni]
MASSSSSNSVPWRRCGATHVAVYGTLRAGGVNDIARLHAGIRRIGVTALTGTLHDLGWYPGLSLAGTQSVLAEVYPLDDALEQAMDGVEGIWPKDVGEYAKRIVTAQVQLPDGGSQRLEVLVYEAQPSLVRGAPVIDASDWLAWYEAQGKPHSNQPFSLRTESSAAPSAD